jgi:hypothetical protein
MRNGLWWLTAAVLIGAGCQEYDLQKGNEPEVLPPETTPPVTAITEFTPEEPVPDIEVAPSQMNFGFWPLECTSDPQVLSISNVGEGDLIVSAVDLIDDSGNVFTLTGSTDTVPPGHHIEFELDFTPADFVLYDQSHVEIWSNDPDETMVQVPLEGEGADDGIFVDQFVQNVDTQVDVLWVVDNSGSMSGEIDNLSSTFSVFINGFVALGLDYQIGVVTTDMDNPAQSGKLLGSPNIITPASADPVADFVAATDQGSSGSGDERGLDAAYAALTDPLILNENAGMVRPGSNLSIVVVTDENDSSDIAPVDFANWLDGYQGDPKLTAFSAVAGPPNGFLPCFAFFSGISAEPAPDYNTVVSRTGGLHLSICDMDMSAILSALALGSSGMKTKWTLTFVPDDSNAIEVYVNGTLVTHSMVDGVSYDPAANQIEFHGAAVPPAGATIEVHYPTEVVCPT